jgi:hypothetical protein
LGTVVNDPSHGKFPIQLNTLPKEVERIEEKKLITYKTQLVLAPAEEHLVGNGRY